MKKRMILITFLIVAFTFLFVIGVSAVDLITSTSDEFGTVNYVDGVNENTTITDKTSRVVLIHGENEYVTFPAYYVSDVELQFQGTVQYKFDALNQAIFTADEIANGKGYDMDSIVRIEILTDSTAMNKNGGAFSNRLNLKEVVFPKGTQLTSLSQQLFKGSAIEKMCIPKSVTSIGTLLFEACASLKEVTFEEGFSMTTLPSSMFSKCTALEKVVFPNCITDAPNRLFTNCTGLKEIRFGENFTTYPSSDGLSISNTCVVYAPSTFLSNIDTISKSTFSKTYSNAYAKTITLFLVGDKACADALVAKATLDTIKNANIIEYDPTKPDSYYVPENPTVWTIVYNYNACKAFYGGVHEGEAVNDCQVVCANCGMTEMAKEPKHKMELEETFDGQKFFSSTSVVVACENCNTVENSLDVTPIFYWAGYSAKTFGEYGFGQQYIINTVALDEYKAFMTQYGKTFSYGVVAAGSSSNGNPLSIVNGAVTNKAGAEFITFDNVSYDAFFMNITGMGEGDLDVALVCCAYVQLGDEIVYLDNNESVSTVTLKSYNQIDAIVNPKEEL